MPRVTVDNKGGAGGTIGLAQFINSSKGDANTMMIGGMVMVGALITNKSPVNLSQVTPIARLTGEYQVVVVPASSKLQSMKELVAQVKANPGSVSWGGGSAGGSDHLLAGMILQAAGVEPAKVNYIAYAGGGEAQADLAAMGGRHQRVRRIRRADQGGKLRALASRRRSGSPASTSRLHEGGVDVDMVNWRGSSPRGHHRCQRRTAGRVAKAVKTARGRDAKRNDWADMYLQGASSRPSWPKTRRASTDRHDLG